MWLAVFAILNVLLVSVLAMNVSRLRARENVSYGDGDKLVMKKAIRAHGNAVEHTAIFAVAVVALEMLHAPGLLMAPLVLGFTLARLAHAWGMLASLQPARVGGAALTYTLDVVAVVALAILVVSR